MEPAVYGCEDNKIISNTVMFRLKTLTILGSKAELASLPEGKLLINTINAHSFNTAKKDQLFADALTNGDVLIPDGVSIVKACKWIKAKSQPKERIAGWDLFSFEMEKLERESEKLRTKSKDPHYTFALIEADKDDNKFVDCAIAANAKCIVSEDKHFRVLKNIPFPKVEVLGIEEFSLYLERWI